MSTRTGIYTIVGYDGERKFWETTIKAGEFTRHQVADLLAMLVCRHLTEDEIVGSVSKGTGMHHFGVKQEGWTFTCGTNPRYVATHDPFALQR